MPEGPGLLPVDVACILPVVCILPVTGLHPRFDEGWAFFGFGSKGFGQVISRHKLL